MKTKNYHMILLLMIAGIGVINQPKMVFAKVNLLPNSNFESWSSPNTLNDWDWVGNDNNITQENTMLIAGKYSAKLTKANSTSVGYLRNPTEYLITVDIASWIHSTVWVYDNNPNASIKLELYKDQNLWTTKSSSDEPDWQQLTITTSAKRDNYIGIRLNIEAQGATPGGDCYIDGASLSINTLKDTIEPHINITSPYSSLPNPSNVWLNFTIDEPCSWIDYSLDGYQPITITGNTLLENLSEGFHVVTVNAEGKDSERVGSSTIGFIVDTIDPVITIHSPLNTTYISDSVWLAVTPLDSSTSWMGYSLDGAGNITLDGDLLLENLSVGIHSLTVYSNDSFSMVESTVCFTVEEPTWSSYTTVIIEVTEVYETIWVTQTKSTADFATLTIFAGLVGVFLLKKRERR